MISELPLFLFTLLTGLGAGAYLISAFFPQKETAGDKVDPAAGSDAPMGARDDEASKQSGSQGWMFALTCLMLIAVGAICSVLHLSHPERILGVAGHPLSSIAQEGIWSIALMVIVAVGAIVSKSRGADSRAISVAGAIVAAILIAVTGFAYIGAYAVPAWVSATTPLMFLAGDVAMGITLFGLFRMDLYGKKSFANSVFAIEAVLAVTLVAGAVQFGSTGSSVVPFVVGIIVAPALSAFVTFFTKSGKLSERSGSILVFACTLIGVSIARYAFYAASII